jgi:hypothetical protein
VGYDFVDSFGPERRGYYVSGPMAMPTVLGDGMSDVWPLSWLEDDYQAHAAQPAPLRISLTENSVGDFTAHIVAEEDVTGARLVMVAVLDEKVPGYGGVSTRLPYHAKVFMTAVTGDAFSIAKDESTDVRRGFAVDPSWDYKAMGVACWVQRPGGVNPSPQPYGDIEIKNEVLQAAFLPAMAASVPEGIESRLELLPPAPNPFTGDCSIALLLHAPSHVRVAVHDVAGRRVATLADRSFGEGRHELVWDGRGTDGLPCAAGLFFIRASAGGETISGKVAKLR